MTANQQFAPPGPWVAQGDPDPFMWVDPWLALERERNSQRYIGWAMQNAYTDRSQDRQSADWNNPYNNANVNNSLRAWGSPHAAVVEIRHELSDPPAPSTVGIFLVVLIFVPLFVAVVTGAIG